MSNQMYTLTLESMEHHLDDKDDGFFETHSLDSIDEIEIMDKFNEFYLKKPEYLTICEIYTGDQKIFRFDYYQTSIKRVDIYCYSQLIPLYLIKELVDFCGVKHHFHFYLFNMCFDWEGFNPIMKLINEKNDISIYYNDAINHEFTPECNLINLRKFNPIKKENLITLESLEVENLNLALDSRWFDFKDDFVRIINSKDVKKLVFNYFGKSDLSELEYLYENIKIPFEMILDEKVDDSFHSKFFEFLLKIEYQLSINFRYYRISDEEDCKFEIEKYHPMLNYIILMRVCDFRYLKYSFDTSYVPKVKLFFNKIGTDMMMLYNPIIKESIETEMNWNNRKRIFNWALVTKSKNYISGKKYESTLEDRLKKIFKTYYILEFRNIDDCVISLLKFKY
jgi:hypothetical protein